MSDDPASPELLAAEYVLGVLAATEMRLIEARAATEPALQTEIALWEDRLAPLTDLVAPVTPPQVLWSRLALATGVGQGPRAAPGVRKWQGATLAALAIAAGFAFFAFLPQPADLVGGPQFVAALSPTGTPVPFLATAAADGSLAITRLAAAAPQTGRDFELWSVPKGAAKPVSLGVLAAGQVMRPHDRLRAETQILVSDEPAGGSPTGQPTGAVVYGGTLTPINPASGPDL